MGGANVGRPGTEIARPHRLGGENRAEGGIPLSHRYPVYHYIGTERKCEDRPVAFPPQHQDRRPGLEWPMRPRPIFDNPGYCGSGKLTGKVALITGGDSGIGRAVAMAFAKEGADVAIAYLDEHEDAAETACAVRTHGRQCLTIAGDLRQSRHADAVVDRVVGSLDRLDVVVNGAAIQIPQQSLLDISDEQLEDTFRTNIFHMFYVCRAALPHLRRGSAIINTSSMTAFEGHRLQVDYSATKGAIATFTRSLANQLADDGIRVNAVAPGPVWTPLIVSSFTARQVRTFGTDTRLRRAAQPFELAPAYVYLASEDSHYMTGEVLHVDGGKFQRKGEA